MKTTSIKSFTDKELISTLLKVPENDPAGSRRTHPVIKGILSVIQDKKDLINYEDLTSIEGIGKETALRVLAVFEITRRYGNQNSGLNPDKVTKPEDCLKFIDRYKNEKQEFFIAINLNGAGEVLRVHEVTKGLLNHSLVHPREVFAPAIEDRSDSIICAHNHPSGSLEPSNQDIAITSQLKEAGALIGIPLIDHLIVSKNGHLSLRERGLI